MSLWSARQLECLEAMGFAPLALAGASHDLAPAHAPAAADAAGRASDPPGSRLHAALLRALRGDADRLAALAIDMAALRDAAAKRALWPRLRALRGARR